MNLNWLQWAIPLIGLGVWILSNLIKNQQDEARRREMRPRPNPQDTDQARREQQPPPRKVERPRPPPRPVETPRRVIEAEIVRPAQRRKPQVVEQPVVVAQLVVPAAPVVAHVAPVVTANRKATKAIQNLHALLKNRQSLGSAFLLNEVFGKPRCKR